MCGIAGYYDHRFGATGDKSVLASMLRSIAHRGPDDAGEVHDGGFAMGMRRLSIIDLETGGQPFWSEDGRYALVCNGEIYNHEGLRRDLQAAGHHFVSASDAEVILHLYEDRGPDCVHQLRGMFAFAVWDARDRSLFLARDHVGIKPLYYANVGGTFVFASEIKTVLEHPAVPRTLSLSALDGYLTYRYVPSPFTMIDGVFALLPGHRLTCSDQQVRVEQWWDLRFQPGETNDIAEDELAHELARLLDESVSMQLMSDVPFGAFLSGGIDSSLVVALATAHLDKPLRTFSVGFAGTDEQRYSELSYARVVADTFGTDHHEVFVSASEYADALPSLTWSLDQPIADYAQPAYHLLARAASDEVKMVLTGEGGDELFAGYARYAGHQFSRVSRRVPRSVHRAVASVGEHVVRGRRPRAALYALGRPTEAEQIACWMPMFDLDQKAAVLHPDLTAQLGASDPVAIVDRHLGHTDATTALNRFLYVDMKMWLPDYLLSRGDKLTMAASLEGRVPLLDHRVVEFAASCPESAKIKRRVRKRLLRRVARAHLPQAVIDRRKAGFSVPFALWARGDLRPMVRDLLAPEVVRRRGLFDHTAVTALLDRHDRGEADHATIIYGLVNLELWYRAFLDGTT